MARSPEPLRRSLLGERPAQYTCCHSRGCSSVGVDSSDQNLLQKGRPFIMRGPKICVCGQLNLRISGPLIQELAERSAVRFLGKGRRVFRHTWVTYRKGDVGSVQFSLYQTIWFDTGLVNGRSHDRAAPQMHKLPDLETCRGWHGLVTRLPWAQEAPGSNPGAPTKTSRVFSRSSLRGIPVRVLSFLCFELTRRCLLLRLRRSSDGRW
jgi:hypothetical protein